MHFGEIRRVDVANGPGVRVSLFVSGCTHRCPGCFNPETWDFHFGAPFGEAQIQAILQYLRPAHIQGLTLLGGEPFHPNNQQALLELVRRVRQELPEKDLWCYSGYLYEALRDGEVGDYSRPLLERLDVLVDGPFVQEQKNLSLRFRGSENQRIIRVNESLAQKRVILWE